MENENQFDKFNTKGYVVIENVVPRNRVEKIRELVSGFFLEGPGTRNILEEIWCRKLAEQLKGHPVIRKIVGFDSACVQCTLFKKNAGKNWLVPLHRDQFVPVREKFEKLGWTGWSIKEGIHFTKPPKAVLSQLVAVRLHLEKNTVKNGPLEVVPESHKVEETNNSRISLFVGAGGAIVLSPLILHASSKVNEGDRTVLHFLFGPRHLPEPAQWRWVV